MQKQKSKLMGLWGILFVLFGVSLFGESHSKTITGGTHATIEFKVQADDDYTLTAAAHNDWEYEGTFSLNGYGGWIKSSDTKRKKEGHYQNEFHYNLAVLFPASMSGKIIPISSGPGSGPPPRTDWSLKGKAEGGDFLIDPQEKLVFIGQDAVFESKYGSQLFDSNWSVYPVEGGSLVASSGAPTDTFTFSLNTAGVYRVEAKMEGGPSNMDTAILTVVDIQLASVQFSSDHGIMKDNNSTWADSGSVYSEPEWISGGSTNNPMSHTKNKNVIVTVQLDIQPSNPGVTFNLTGTGGDTGFNFEKTGISSPNVTITSTGKIPDKVSTITNQYIAWDLKVTSLNTPVERELEESGPHKIYVTYGTPAGSTVTERRIREVCISANGKSDSKECTNAVFDNLSGQYNLGASMWGPTPVWLLHNSSESSQCPGLAKYVNVHFQMLGLGAGIIKYCRAKPDGSYEATSSAPSTEWRWIPDPNIGHPMPTTHDDEYQNERLAHLDGDGKANAYEATCFFNGFHYALGVSRIRTTAKGVVQDAFTDIRWEYRTGTLPTTYIFHGCAELPWIEN